MNDKTKENKIEEVTAVIKKVTEKKDHPYKRGDTLTIQGKNVVVVEVITPFRYHVKNLASPFDSFIITGVELLNEKEGINPDLMVREDKRFSL